MMMNYVLDENDNPVLEPDLLTWARWYETADRHVALTELDGIKISTVFLGVDHNFSTDGPPILFETMIFGGEHDEECWRYATLGEAQAGHDEAVLMIGSPPGRVL